MDKKYCGYCKIEKNIKDFYKNSYHKDGLNNWCKVCCSEYLKNSSMEKKQKLQKYRKEYNIKNKKILNKKQAEYRKKNREIIRIRKLRDNFKISYEKAKTLYKKKIGGICDICKQKEASKRFLLSVDHSHETGKIRGLLCNNCNRGLGHFKDNIKYLNNTINYLRKTK